MTWDKTAKGKEDWANRGKNESAYLVNGWLTFGWLLSYIPLYGEVSKLTSNWNEVK